MKCPNCGKEKRIRNYDKFCLYCGFDFKDGLNEETRAEAAHVINGRIIEGIKEGVENAVKDAKTEEFNHKRLKAKHGEYEEHSESIMVPRIYFNGLQKHISWLIRNFCSKKQRLDDADIKTLDNLIEIRKLAGYEYAKEYSDGRRWHFVDRHEGITRDGTCPIGDCADNDSTVGSEG